MSAKAKVKAYTDYFGTTYLESYFDLVDMGEISESDSLKAWATKSGPFA